MDSDVATGDLLGEEGGGVAQDPSLNWGSCPLSARKLKLLRPDQQQAVERWEADKQGIVVMPTGTGKTEVALHILQRLGCRALFVATTRALCCQLASRLEEAFGVSVGMIGDGVFRLEPISVATYKSAAIKMERIGGYFKLLVFDECHHLSGDGMLLDAARMSAAPWRLGLTATPRRSADGSPTPAETLIGPVCFETSIAAARGKTLASYEIVRLSVRLTDEERQRYDALGRTVQHHIIERRKEHPAYGWAHVIHAMAQDPDARRAYYAVLARRSMEEHAEEKLNVLEELLARQSQQVVIFTGSNKMARAVSCRFLIPTLLASTGKWERDQILGGYKRGDFPAIVANKILNEGIDIPTAKVAFVLGGGGSTREAIQRLGRILRPNGEEQARLYEIVCKETGEEERSRRRRKNDAYQKRGPL